MHTQKGSPGPEWKHAWRDAKTGDDVYLHEDDGAVFLDMADRGHEHCDGVFCHLCLPRLNAAGDAAKKCLDPKASAFLEEIASKDDGPEVLALAPSMSYSTGIDRKSFSMRQDGGTRMVFTKPILTTKKDNKPLGYPIFLAEHDTRNQVCDANYLRTFSVRLKDGVPEHYARRLWEAKLTFNVDGESLIKWMPLKEALQQKEVVLPKPATDGSCLFSALGIMDVGGPAEAAVASEWLGYMLPNGTKIRVTLEDVEGGGGLIFVETSFKLVRYTTKKKPAKA